MPNNGLPAYGTIFRVALMYQSQFKGYEFNLTEVIADVMSAEEFII